MTGFAVRNDEFESDRMTDAADGEFKGMNVAVIGAADGVGPAVVDALRSAGARLAVDGGSPHGPEAIIPLDRGPAALLFVALGDGRWDDLVRWPLRHHGRLARTGDGTVGQCSRFGR